MDAYYNQLRKITADIETESEPLLNSYQGQLMGNSPWYLALGSIQGWKTSVREVTADLSEKKEVIKSLENFVEEKVVEEKAQEAPFPSEKSQLKSYSKTTEAYFNQLDDCKFCPEKCSKAVYEGKSDYEPVEVMFVGDFPFEIQKHDEESETLCFTGTRRELLLNMIKAMKLTEEQFSLSLAAKCPSESEELTVKNSMVNNCINHLENEISLIKPKVVVALGAFATNHLLGERKKLSQVHGQFFEKSAGKHTYQVVPVFHPDFLLINPKMKQTAWLDLQKIMKFLEK